MNSRIAILGFVVLSSCGGASSQESCRAQAAKEASSKEALDILLQDCERRFPATENPDGTFSLFVVELGREVKVSNASPNDADKEMIKKLIKQQEIDEIKSQRHRSKRMKNAQSGFEVQVAKIQCSNSIGGDCYNYSGIFTVKNNSPVKITKVFFGYAIGAGLDCSGVQNYGKEIEAPIWPGQTVTQSFDIPFISDKSGTGCASLIVADVE
ncbi:MAG: hypothetical protein ACK440_03980 [Sphingomonadaceae bacterium]|jgi:hypothetical protein